MASNKRRNSSYRRTAARVSKFIPALKELSEKRELTRTDKAKITRAAERLNRVRQTGQLVPVTEKQAKTLGKKALAAPGFRAIFMDGFGRDSKVVLRNGKASIVTKPIEVRGVTRNVHLVHKSAADPESYMAAVQAVFDRHHSKRVTVWLWTVRGRGHRGSGTMRQFDEYASPVLFGNKYSISAAELIVGFQYMLTETGKPSGVPMAKRKKKWRSDAE